MGIIVGLLIFWTGAIFTGLSVAGKIAVAPWLVITIWLVALTAFIGGYVIAYRASEKREREKERKKDCDDTYNYVDHLY